MCSLWCKKWRMRVNVNKTKVESHRITSQTVCTINVKYGMETIKITSQYKYLGVILDEHPVFKMLVSILPSSTYRSLGSI